MKTKILMNEANKVLTCMIIILLCLNYTTCEVVCTEDELVKELIEDIEDNGKLDCLRESLPVPGETPKEKNMRLKANWDSDCSFESISDGTSWITRPERSLPK